MSPYTTFDNNSSLDGLTPYFMYLDGLLGGNASKPGGLWSVPEP